MLVLESGPYVDRTGYPSDPLEALPLLYRDGGMTIATGKPAIPVPVGRTVGGTTVINSGTCFRAPREVLEEWRDREGVDWATDLDPLYEAAEETLAVTPLDLETLGRNGQLCAEGAEALGASGGPISRNAGRCVQCSSCPLGCRHRREAGRACLLPSPRRRRRGAGPGRRPGAAGADSRTAGPPASPAGPACPPRAPRSCARNGRPPPAATGRSARRR